MNARTIDVAGARLDVRATPGGVVWTRWAVRAEGRDAALAVARELVPFVREAQLPLLAWEKPGTEEWLAALDDAGFRVHRRKLFVQRPLTDLPDPGREFGWRALATMSDAEFVPYMAAASDGDPFEGTGERDYRKEWDDLVRGTGELLDPDLWRLALVGDDVVGVVLPKVWREDDPPGTLCYVGVLPELRGRGLGCRLHAWGLHLLAGAGAARYVGSTDERNAAMARVFARNGCDVTGVQVFLTAPAR